jgi:hypothetical protein
MEIPSFLKTALATENASLEEALIGSLILFTI